MFPKSRLIILTAALFFFLTADLTASVRCLDDWASIAEQSGTGSAENSESDSDAGSLHCPDYLKAYALGNLTNLRTQETDLKEQNHAAVSCSNPSYPFTSRISVASSPSLSPYRLVPVYQLKVVYRI